MFNKKIDLIEKNPFKLFKIDNFLSKELYNAVNQELPEIEDFSKNEFDNFRNNKFAFDTKSEIHKKIIPSRENLKIFEEIVFSKEFSFFFFKKFYFDFLKSRLNRPRHIIKLFKIPKIVDNLDKDNIRYYLGIFNQVKIEMQFSYILNGGKIVPHTDSGEKLLSLMLYFPSNKYDKIKQKNLGTSFWKSKMINFDNFHQYDEESFKKEKLIYKTPFEDNVLYGFIKNEKSWHSVDKINFSENYVRKSLNINFYF